MSSLFPEKPTIHFKPNTSICCNSPMHVQKTRTRIKTATLAIGSFIAKETVLYCLKCGSIQTSEELQRLIPDGCNFGYDVLVHVGKSLFLKCRNDRKIIRDLSARNIAISSSGIAYLAKKFIVYLAIAHRESSPLLKDNMAGRGGYILHLDGTCEGDSPHLMSGLDGISEIALDNIKLPSENGKQIIPFLKRIKKNFGKPLALVRDMGKGISNAIESVFGDNIPDFICHFHFLRDLGKDLFGKENDIIRKQLKRYGVQGLLRKKALQFKKIMDDKPELTSSLCKSLDNENIDNKAISQFPLTVAYTLIQWALDGKKQGKGYGFPFDRPHLVFYQRLKALFTYCETLQNINLQNRWQDNKPIFQIYNLLQKTTGDYGLRKTARQMEEKILVFDKIREAMRIAQPEQNRGLNDDGTGEDIKTIQKGVKDFRGWLVNEKLYTDNNDYGKMVKQIDKYWKKLFADPITVRTPQGKISVQPQRTNNILERFFRDIKRSYRKKSGTNNMSKTLKAMLADTPLVKNLEKPEYVKIILNGRETLEERFAEIDTNIVRAELNKAINDGDRIPSKIHNLIKKPGLPEKLIKLFIEHDKR